MLPVVHGEQRTKFEMLAYTLILLPLTLMPAFFGALGAFYGVAAAAAGRPIAVVLRPAAAGAVVDTGGLEDVSLLVCSISPYCSWPWDRPGPALRSPSGQSVHPRSARAGARHPRRRAPRPLALGSPGGFRAPGRLVRLWPRVRAYRGMLALASLTLTVSALLGLAFPMVVRYLLDAAFVQHDRAVLDRIAIGLVILFSVQALLNYAQTYLLSAVGERVVAGPQGRALFQAAGHAARLLRRAPDRRAHQPAYH